MYHLLIADDEWPVIQNVSTMVNWLEHGFISIDTASNGLEAYEKCMASTYHVVISDIRMPGMEGLELIEKLREQKPDIKILIISGYNEFDYAKQALKLGVKGYLLKPIEPEELLQHVLELKRELDQEFASRLDNRETLAAAKEAFLLRIVSDVLPVKEVNRFSKLFGLHPLEKASSVYQSVLLDIDNYGDLSRSNILEASLVKYGLRNIAEELIGERRLGWVYDDPAATLGILLYDAAMQPFEREKLLEQIQLKMREFFRVKLHAGIGTIKPSIHDIRVSRREAQYALGQCDDHKLLHHYQEDSGGQESFSWDMDWSPDALLTAIEQLDKHRLSTEVDRLVHKLKQSRSSAEVVRGVLYSIWFGIRHTFSKMGVPGVEDVLAPYASTTSAASYGDAGQVLMAAAQSAIDALLGHRERYSVDVVQQMKRYAEEHFREELSLKEVSGILYLNAAYLGQLFRKKTGMTFNDYVHAKRIEYVKRLLVHDTLRVTEILQRAGYLNAKNFYKYFKRLEGTSFQDYHSALKLRVEE